MRICYLLVDSTHLANKLTLLLAEALYRFTEILAISLKIYRNWKIFIFNPITQERKRSLYASFWLIVWDKEKSILGSTWLFNAPTQPTLFLLVVRLIYKDRKKIHIIKLNTKGLDGEAIKNQRDCKWVCLFKQYTLLQKVVR